MGMEDYVDVLIANLKVLGAVPNGGRLAVRRGQLSVDTVVHGQCVTRFWYGDSRETTLQHVKNAVSGAVRTTDALMATQKPVPLEWKSLWTLDRIACEMEGAEFGLRNLRSTYASDAGVNAALHVISERLQAHAMVIRAFIKSQSVQKTAQLRERA